MDPKSLELDIYLREIELSERVQELGEEVSKKYSDRNPLFVSVLSGAFIFTSDLLRSLTVHHDLEFTKVKSYEGTQSGPVLDFQLDIDHKMEGREVILIEDIVDSGRTLDFLIHKIKEKKPKSVSIVSLLWKPNKYRFKHTIDFVGFSIPDFFVVGYGMDYNGYGRNLKDIYILNQDKLK